MSKYGVFFNAYTTTTTATSAIGLDANASGEEGEIIELLMTGAGSAAAADRQHRAQLVMCTYASAGIWGTTPTPEPFHQGSAAAEVLATIEATTEPGVVGTVFPVLYGFNQRGGMRWAVPQGEGYHIHADGGTERGATIQTIASAAGNLDASMHFWLKN